MLYIFWLWLIMLSLNIPVIFLNMYSIHEGKLPKKITGILRDNIMSHSQNIYSIHEGKLYIFWLWLIVVSQYSSYFFGSFPSWMLYIFWLWLIMLSLTIPVIFWKFSFMNAIK
jgi:hypothetical protein